jgi:hypothetical protein
MERHFVDTAKDFVYYPYLKKARLAVALFPIMLGGGPSGSRCRPRARESMDKEEERAP